MREAVFPWLPLGHAVAGGAQIGRVQTVGHVLGSVAYQICETQGDNVCLLLKINECSSESLASFEKLNFPHHLNVRFGGDEFWSFVCHQDDAPMKVGDIPTRFDFLSFAELNELFLALAKIKNKNWHSALYFPIDQSSVAFAEPETMCEKRRLLTKLLTGGVADTNLSPVQIHNINRWISPSQIRVLYKNIGIDMDSGKEKKTVSLPPSSMFVLPGQPVLENFFREQIIDYYHRQNQYEKMNVRPVKGILLHGKPGTGKTYAVCKLAEFLGWNIIEINVSNVGSKYIHETSHKIKKRFDEAKKNSPAIVFLDEFDALGSSREAAGQSHKIEETNELLRQIEKAGDDGLLVIAATNYLGAIDSALIRKGRFDAVIEVAFPEEDALECAIRHCLSDYPHRAGLMLGEMAKNLAGRSMADVAWMVNKAAQIAVKSEKERIDRECLDKAMRLLPARSNISFIL